MNFKDCLQTYGQQAGYEFTPGQLTDFALYFEMLIETNKVMNLTAITEIREVVLKHLLDSLSVYQPELFPPGVRLCDLGTGAGFPGIPLKIYRPEIQLTLLDSLAKRLKFLQSVIDRLQLETTEIYHARAEDAGQDKLRREAYDLVVSRAVAKLAVLAEYCLPLVKPGGYFIAQKAANYAEEITQGQRALTILGGEIVQVKQVELPDLAEQRVVIYIRKTGKTPAVYPRKAGTPEKNPL